MSCLQIGLKPVKRTCLNNPIYPQKKLNEFALIVSNLSSFQIHNIGLNLLEKRTVLKVLKTLNTICKRRPVKAEEFKQTNNIFADKYTKRKELNLALLSTMVI